MSSQRAIFHLETFFELLNAKYSRMQLRPSQFLIHFEIFLTLTSSFPEMKVYKAITPLLAHFRELSPFREYI